MIYLFILQLLWGFKDDYNVFLSLVRQVELVAALCSQSSGPISDNDAVLHTSEDFSVSPSILYLA